MTTAIVAGLVAAPLILAILLRSNSALMFLILCASAVLLNYSGEDLVGGLQRVGVTDATPDLVNYSVVGLPLLITALVSRHSFSRSKIWLYILPALAAGGLLAILLVPLINTSLNLNLTSDPTWENLQKYQTFIIGIGTASSLFLMWFNSLKHYPKKHR